MNESTFVDLLQDGIAETSIPDDKIGEALCNIDITLRHAVDVAYFCASMNLLNAWMKLPREGYKPNYVFKGTTAHKISTMLKRPIQGVEVYVSLQEKVLYLRVMGLQFSYHNVELTDTLKEYQASDANVLQEWVGIRLQPKACLILDWTDQQRQAFYREYWMQRLWKQRALPSDET